MSAEIKKYLDETISIIQDFDSEMDKNGNHFNIFSILKVSANEVRLHSNFLSELLNVKGSHSFGSKFFELFLSNLEAEFPHLPLNFDSESITISVEESIGFINEDYTSGGSLDIIITDKLKRKIIIENKIFAIDQRNQLLRYYNSDKNAVLLYLTLDGKKASEWSTNNEIFCGQHYYCISYKDFISKWLDECIKESKPKPRVKETISQYLDIINNYTQQSKRNKMAKDIIDLISKNKDFYNSIEELNEAYHSFRQGVKEKFWNKLSQKRPNGCTIYKTEKNIEIKYYIEEDGLGLYYGFYIEENGRRIEEKDEIFRKLVTILKGKISSEFNQNESYAGWRFFSEKVFRKFWLLDKEKIFDLNTDTEMDKLINQIVEELDSDFEKIKNELCEETKK